MSWNRKYRERKSPRTRGWDYSQTAAYFITICTKDRQLFFGDIRNGIMGLSHIGIIANWYWLQIPHQFSHVELDEYIIMPNHMHGILTIYDQRKRNHRNHTDAINRVRKGNMNRAPVDDVSGNRVPLNDSMNQPGGATGRNNPMLSEGNLGKIIRWYKGRCTFEIRQRSYHSFQWQGRYWDHIIQDDRSRDRIREYIYNNPINWKSDLYYETE